MSKKGKKKRDPRKIQQSPDREAEANRAGKGWLAENFVLELCFPWPQTPANPR